MVANITTANATLDTLAGAPPHGPRLLVGAGMCSHAVGADEVVRALRHEAGSRGLTLPIVEAGCTGMCWDNVQVTLQRPGRPDLTWGRVRPNNAATLLDIATDRADPASIPHGFAWTHDSVEGLPGTAAVPFLAGQRRVLLEHTGRLDPASLADAVRAGVYRGLARSLSLTPEAVIAEVKQSGLAGRGGAYFPAGMKWEGTRANPAPRYLVVNAEEGEPGVFKDRHLLEGNPHLLIEGTLIAAYALGAARAYIYVNGEARLAAERLERALEQARQHGLIGQDILGSGFSCDMEVRLGGGGYVLGEESAMLESIEGRRSMPRVRPPFAFEYGLWGHPTAINNAETVSNAGIIMARGAAWYAQTGTQNWRGTKLVCLSGDVARPGLAEIAMGTTLRALVEEIAGGVPHGRALQAVLTEGPSGVFVPPALLDTALEPRLPDVVLGSGNISVLDETRSIMEALRRLMHYNADESCGKCTPCREGVRRMAEILDRVAEGEARPSDRDDLLLLCDVAASASICGLGQMAPGPVLSALKYFPLAGLTQPEGGLEGHRRAPASPPGRT